jgi:hypothetical protein
MHFTSEQDAEKKQNKKQNKTIRKAFHHFSSVNYQHPRSIAF